MTSTVQHIAAETYHGRRGAVKNAFHYSIDYVLLDAEAELATPTLFSRNAGNLMSLHDNDHGGAPKAGVGAAWVRNVLSAYDIEDAVRIELLAQPRVLGHVFNPVSFWLCYDADDALTTVIAEVTNTFGDRHSYLCRHADGRAITKDETLSAQKLMHVSPFQPIEGGYTFRFDIQPDAIGIWIDYSRGNGGLIATLTGPRKPITNTAIIKAALRRPFGSRRVLALIHWQAIKLWWKGATFRSQPEPPADEVSR
ncbi:cyclopropane-fatty-acyl-phospholipid synthase [Loktanella sp. 1ANDIMAR09]|nr:cyclopropane-fatty-acyl-phospholipid synthase [Loktanella sp. 1ANDIMAR09]